jgi:hypothetical protein
MLERDELDRILRANRIELKHFRVGSGGSAIVHRGLLAQPDRLPPEPPQRDVAIKEYKDEVVAKPEQVNRIRQEFHACKNISHPNVVDGRCPVAC